MTNLFARFLVLSVLVAASACGEPSSSLGSDEPGAPDPSGSFDGTWKLLDGHGSKGEVPIIPGYRITLDIEGTTIGGSAACNGYGGKAEIDGASFAALEVSSTEMGCKRAVMDSESAYLAALLAADTISMDRDVLTLSGEDTKLRFAPVAPIPTAQLVDTRWELESLVYGGGDEGIVSSAAPAQLTLNSDGTISGTTGCRDLYGQWVEDGDEILFTTFGAEGKCPEELRGQDDHVVSVLGDGFEPGIDGDRLSIVSQGGAGLDYRAAD